MIIVLRPNISQKEEAAVIKEIRKLGYKPHIMRGVTRTVIGAIGDERTHQTLETLTSWKQVESVMPVQKRYKLVSREAHRTGSTIDVRGNIIGGKKVQIMAGPCSVESEKQLLSTARAIAVASPASSSCRNACTSGLFVTVRGVAHNLHRRPSVLKVARSSS